MVIFHCYGTVHQAGYFEGSGWMALAGALAGPRRAISSWTGHPREITQDPTSGFVLFTITFNEECVKANNNITKHGSIWGIIITSNWWWYYCRDSEYFYLFATFFEIFCLSVYPELNWGWPMPRIEKICQKHRGPCRSTHLGGGKVHQCTWTVGHCKKSLWMWCFNHLQPMSIHEHVWGNRTSLVAPAMNCFTHAKNRVYKQIVMVEIDIILYYIIYINIYNWLMISTVFVPSPGMANKFLDAVGESRDSLKQSVSPT